MKYQLFLITYKPAERPSKLLKIGEVLICERETEQEINVVKHLLYAEKTTRAIEHRTRESLFTNSIKAMITAKHGSGCDFTIETRRHEPEACKATGC